MSKKHLLFAGILSLFGGSAIYILARPTSLLMFQWFSFLGLSTFVEYFRNIASPAKYLLPYFVIYSLPLGLWLLSYLLFVEYIWFNKIKSIQYYLWFWIFPVISVSIEILQQTSLVIGTFDYQDIVVLIFATLLGYTISVYNNNKTFNQRRVAYDT